jgi:hypothetical protein
MVPQLSTIVWRAQIALPIWPAFARLPLYFGRRKLSIPAMFARSFPFPTYNNAPDASASADR